MAFYGLIMLMAGLAYFLLQGAIIRTEGSDSLLARALGADFKGKLSLVAYVVAIPSAFFSPWIAGALFVAVSLMWLIPDRRIERVLDGPPGGTGD
jgi:uncharacterized membrane protein